MSDLTTMYAEILADPDSDDKRLAYADAIVHDDPDRAEFIKLDVTLSRWKRELSRPAGWADAHARVQVLFARHKEAWTRDVEALGWIRYPTLIRGFVSLVRVSAADFLAHGVELYQRAPILYLNIDDLAPVATAFFQSPLLARIVSLRLRNNDLDDAAVLALTTSPRLSRLRWLDLSGNRIGMRGLEALCQTSQLPALRYVDFENNLAPDPTPKIGGFDAESATLLELDYPDFGRELEQRFGKKPWLSPPLRPDFPPDPDAV